MKDAQQRNAPEFLLQLFWSDPSDSDAEMARGVHSNPGRGAGKNGAQIVTFGQLLKPIHIG